MTKFLSSVATKSKLKNSVVSMYTKLKIGRTRSKAERHQLGGLLLLAGFCALLQPMVGVATAAGPDQTPLPYERMEFVLFVGGLCVMLEGLLAMMVGYLELVQDVGMRRLTQFAIVWAQTAWIPYITNMIAVVRQAKTGTFVIPTDGVRIPTNRTDELFMGALGVLGIVSYGFALIGSIAFYLFAILAHQSDKGHTRDAVYFRQRATIYSINFFIGGFAQVMLGIYLWLRFIDTGFIVKQDATVLVGPFLVTYPWMAIVVGGLQTLGSLLAFFRSRGHLIRDENDNRLQLLLTLAWLAQVVLQIMAQAIAVPTNAFVPTIPTMVTFTLSSSIILGYLDFRHRTESKEIEPIYYGVKPPKEEKKDEEEGKTDPEGDKHEGDEETREEGTKDDDEESGRKESAPDLSVSAFS